MKKYRITKITVKTRETVSVSPNAAAGNQSSVCPVCHTPLSASLTLNEVSAAKNPERQAAELPANIVSGIQNELLKGDLQND